MSDSPEKRPITLEDLSRIALVSDPQAQPNGDLLAWVVTHIDNDADTYASAIWVSSDDGADARQLTSGRQKDTSPRWSPDGKSIAFISNRAPMLPSPKAVDEDQEEKASSKDKDKARKDEKPAGASKPKSQVWTIRVDGGEATQVTNHPNGASSPSWSPDGAEIAFAASDDVRDEDEVPAPMTNGGVADERVIRDLSYRFDAIGYRERYSHIWKVSVATGEMTQLTSGDVQDRDPQWSPDGSKIAFVGNRRKDRKYLLGARSILTVPATGGLPTVISADDATFDAPSWSPDGSRIAFTGHLDAKNNSANDTLWTVPANGGDATNHTKDWDTSLGDYGMSDMHASSDNRPRWRDDNTVLFLASRRGETQIHACDLGSGSVTALTSGKRRISGFTHTSSGLAYVSGMIHQPSELYTSRADGSGQIQITFTNKPFLDEILLSEAIDLDVTAPDGWGIQAWLLPPANVDTASGEKFPLIVEIHGGPHGMYGYDFFHEMQLMAAKGYGVLFCNPRGSAGYGEHFTSCTRARWGESDMPDVIASLDTAIDRFDWIDTSRLGVTGGSYGGYLTNWIVSHDDRFKAAVTQRCVSNFYSFFGTSDIGVNFGEFEFGGVPWRDAELLLKYSPISYVDQMTTPLLIIHSENDLRCPIEQAEQMFTALKYLQREVEFVRIPEESHGLSRDGTPSRRRARLHHIIGWFDSHL
jgi:dipeptidyl aminopeptidase/acylaminoacyl peptidase